MDPIPAQLGLFPLPHVVLFPNALLPLHVFETRYQALLRDSLAGSERFVMAVLKPGHEESPAHPDIYRHACVGRVVEHQPLEDGRSDLILKGERVVEIGRVVSLEPYRTVEVRCSPSDTAFAESPGARDRILELKRLLEDACPGCVEALREHMPDEQEPEGGLTLLHTIAMHLPVEIPRKLEWLRCPDSLARWTKIRRTLIEMGRARTERNRIFNCYEDLQPDNPSVN
jgi:Lon protease-like protein